MNKKIAYLIKNISEYGKLISYCIEHDINVWRTYWNENDKDTCYFIDWQDKRCYYSSYGYYKNNDYTIIEPCFYLDAYGHYALENAGGFLR